MIIDYLTQPPLNKLNSNQADKRYFGDELRLAFHYLDELMRWAIYRARNAGLGMPKDFQGYFISDEQAESLANQSIESQLWSQFEFTTDKEESIKACALQARKAWLKQATTKSDNTSRPSLHRLGQLFNFSEHELDILLFCVANEIDPRFERIFGYLQDDINKKHPTVNFILDCLANEFETKIQLRSLFEPNSPLSRFRIIRFLPSERATFLSTMLGTPFSIVEWLLGSRKLDLSLEAFARIESLAEEIEPYSANLLSNVIPPVYVISGTYGVGKSEFVKNQVKQLGFNNLIWVNATQLSDQSADYGNVFAELNRDAILHQAAIIFYGFSNHSNLASSSLLQITRFEQLAVPVFLSLEDKITVKRNGCQKQIIYVSLPIPPAKERVTVWQKVLGDQALELDLTMIGANFPFSAGQIEDVALDIRDYIAANGSVLTEKLIASLCRRQSDHTLEKLATKITPKLTWENLVLPQETLADLNELTEMVRLRSVIYDEWGFGETVSTGRGASALFVGPPGTGKTLSAEIVANELGLDLYRVDLSTVVDKYIGETEKNLAKIFDAASVSNAVLFFDEADALFGKRGDVKDSHDRYANIQTGYLLQRIESYEGITVLATNLRGNLDKAFTRRFDFIVDFPFPDAESRHKIWLAHLPNQLPRTAEIDWRQMAEQFELSGGHIRNIVLGGAFLAASDTGELQTRHILAAVKREYKKMGRLMSPYLATTDKGHL